MQKGRFLDPGQAKNQYDAFWTFVGGTKFPISVCYTLKELSEFYIRANEMMAQKNVPEEQRGVAITLGIHLDQGSSHARNKVTLMMVATQFKDNNDPHAGKVDAINNPILKAGWPAQLTLPPDIDDLAYDAGSLWP